MGCEWMLARFATLSASVVSTSVIEARRRHGGRHHAGGASPPTSTWISPRHTRRATTRVLAASSLPGILLTV
ncbi:MAG: hypothetical protein WAK71_04190 [Streptosporangiaceae bacterium]